MLVARRGEVLLHEGYGLADRGARTRNDRDTVFGLGSVSKPITSAAVLVLHEQGAIDLEHAVGRYIPDLPDGGGHATIHQLLTHTPNGRFEYANANYVALARLIEHVTGEPFDAFLQRCVLEPAGMGNTGVGPPDAGRPAVGYSAFEDRVVPGERIDLSVQAGAAGLYSTAGDLFALDRALRDGTLLSERTAERLFAPHGGPYGYGWFVESEPHEGYPGRRIYHGGLSDAGYFARLTRFDADDVVIVTLSNFLLSPLERMNRDLAWMYAGDGGQVRLPERSNTEALRPARLIPGLERLAGAYEAFMPIPVSVEAERLFVRVFGFKLELFLARETAERIECAAMAACVRVGFVKDGAGGIAGAEVHWLGEEGYYARRSEEHV